MIFLSCKANARVHDVKSGHGPQSPPRRGASPKRLKNSHIPSMRQSQSGLRTQRANPARFRKWEKYTGKFNFAGLRVTSGSREMSWPTHSQRRQRRTRTSQNARRKFKKCSVK